MYKILHHLGCIKLCKQWWINYQPQQVEAGFWTINSTPWKMNMFSNNHPSKKEKSSFQSSIFGFHKVPCVNFTLSVWKLQSPLAFFSTPFVGKNHRGKDRKKFPNTSIPKAEATKSCLLRKVPSLGSWRIGRRKKKPQNTADLQTVHMHICEENTWTIYTINMWISYHMYRYDMNMWITN